MLKSLARRSTEMICENELWFGKRVKIIDGTMYSMPDTEENQKEYPQPDSQKKGCGFPKIRIVAVFSLINGVLLNYASGRYRESERSLFLKIMDSFKKGDVALADRGFSGYADFSVLLSKKVDFVIRLRKKDHQSARIIKEFNKNDRIKRWVKPSIKPRWMDKKLWKKVPESIDLRIVSYRIKGPGFRTHNVTVATSLLNPEEIPTAAFKELYLKRWRAEIYFKDIKTSMNMEMLSCKSPEMIHKEILMYFIGYNLIRLTIYESARVHNVCLERISFKGALQAVWLRCFDKSKNVFKELLEIISKLKNPRRPGRREPRAVKRRPKRHQYMTAPRDKFQEDPHRGKRAYS